VTAPNAVRHYDVQHYVTPMMSSFRRWEGRVGVLWHCLHSPVLLVVYPPPFRSPEGAQADSLAGCDVDPE
jgi:hypothetical protein